MAGASLLGRCMRNLHRSSQMTNINFPIVSCVKQDLLSNNIHPTSTYVQTMKGHNYYMARKKDPFKVKMNLRFKVIYPEDGQYTVEHLPMKHLAGRDPETGRIVLHNIGGGRKTFYRWVDVHRTGPTEEGKFLEERVLAIEKDPNRSAFLALVGNGNHLRYLIATSSMKAGDIIRTSSYIPSTLVRPKEGDAYPLGALPTGTIICCFEIAPGAGMRFKVSSGSSSTITAREKGKVVVTLTSRCILALDPKCMAVVGRVSNAGHRDLHIGSGRVKRWLGRRPRLGLKQKKGPQFGRKKHAAATPKEPVKRKIPYPTVVLTAKPFGPQKNYVVGYNRRNKY